MARKEFVDIEDQRLEIKKRQINKQSKKVEQKKANGLTKGKKILAVSLIVMVAFGAGVEFYREHGDYIESKIEAYRLEKDIESAVKRFPKSQKGNVLSSYVKRDENGNFDYNNEENIKIHYTDDGEKIKTGPIIDYYNGLEEYVRDETGKSYYRYVYDKWTEEFSEGKEPDDSHFPYTYYELDEKFKEDTPKIGGK